MQLDGQSPAEAAPKTRLILVCLVVLGLLLANCSASSQAPEPTSEAQSSSARSADNPLAYIRSVDPAASNDFFKANRQLFEYDQDAPQDIQEVTRRIENGLSIVEITYASPKGGRVPARLIIPQGTGPFAGIVMQYSMDLEFGMRYAEYGAVVIYVDPPSFRPQDTGPRDILTFTEQDREEQLQLIIDLRRAIDLLTARPDVDPERIAYVGVKLVDDSNPMFPSAPPEPKAPSVPGQLKMNDVAVGQQVKTDDGRTGVILRVPAEFSSTLKVMVKFGKSLEDLTEMHIKDLRYVK